MITKADKGKTTVNIDNTEYKKTLEFINNTILKLNKDPTNNFKKKVIENLKQGELIINKNQTKHPIQRKPQVPTLKAKIKLHKIGTPIRPVVNNINEPTYKLAKIHLKNTEVIYIQLQYQYNVKNSTNLAQDLKNIIIKDKYQLITFDIKDLYVNIPIEETINITKALLMAQNNNNNNITLQMLKLIKTMLQQNYFAFNGNIYQPKKGISMGSPLSGEIAEIFLYHLEKNNLKQIMDNKNIILYTRYVDDLIIIYNSEHISADNINEYLNNTHPSLMFTPTHEINKTISFLDLLITTQHTALDIDIFKKPTTTDTTINYHSNHPLEHKTAAYRFLINRMISLPLTNSNKKKRMEPN